MDEHVAYCAAVGNIHDLSRVWERNLGKSHGGMRLKHTLALTETKKTLSSLKLDDAI